MRMDPLLTAADAALRTLFVPARASRDCPTVPERPNEALSDDERRLSGALMRVNHVGEVCAQALYTAQAAVTRDPALRAHLADGARQAAAALPTWAQQAARFAAVLENLP